MRETDIARNPGSVACLFEPEVGEHPVNRHSVRFFAAGLIAAFAAQAGASDDVRMVGVVFDRGADTFETTDTIAGKESVMYRFKGKDGQYIRVSLRPNNQHTDFVLRAPGKWPGEEMYNSQAGGGREYEGQLYRDGFHSITVFQGRSGGTSQYDLVVTLSDAPGSTRSLAVSRAESDCLAAVANQVGSGDVSTISVEEGETSTKVMVRVPGARAPWQCNWGYRDGAPAVLEVFYAGEG